LRNYIIILIAGILLSCKSSQKGFSLFSVSEEEKALISDAKFIEAISQKNKSNYDKAIPLLEDIIKSSKSQDAAYYELATIYQATKKLPRSIKTYRQSSTVRSEKQVVFEVSNRSYKEFGFIQPNRNCL